MPLTSEADLFVRDLAAAVSKCDDPYSLATFVVHGFLNSLTLSTDDKQDILADVSDIFDGLPPSDRSGFINEKKKGKRASRS
ncbi:hypothetical protein [Herminiimonas arsenitoxidans]|uniref:hypothetical protein n=1 Tax=Herminiimonas arsenitoxidans TaxID=1809410 RepID=UPI00097070A9|nr:hypothetical protein [Herminiimonas arsenitoxidans]